jgi:hypothetical protein
MTTLSQKFLFLLKVNRLPSYRIAQEAGINPNTLSKLVNGIENVKERDPRICAVGAVLGLKPSECFESSGENQ